MEALHYMLFEAAPLDNMPTQPGYKIKTYAIVDGAADKQHYKQLLQQDLNYAILYKSEDAKKLESVAPYLIELDSEHDYTRWLLTEHWDQHNTCFIKSHYALEPLAEHFRRYTKIVIEPRDNNIQASEAFFAFYDPRVLKNYFSLLTKEQMTEFCQPVIAFSYEDEDQSDHLLTSYLSSTEDTWYTQTTRLSSLDPSQLAASGKTEEEPPLAELEDELDVPMIPVIFSAAQQDAFDEHGRRQFCRQLLSELQHSYPVSLDDEDDAVRYSKEAAKIGLLTEATQSRYILTGLLINDSPIHKSKRLKQSLQQAPDELTRMQTLEHALNELSINKEYAHAR